ncbi:hypothetical protein B0H10DRAFT_1965424 [Mycena sp. CBHHK59/15]|nr:hypothetical protein B0H10DRAFT_1965424 [Mycena sp. CBHHK59/15]
MYRLNYLCQEVGSRQQLQRQWVWTAVGKCSDQRRRRRGAKALRWKTQVHIPAAVVKGNSETQRLNTVGKDSEQLETGRVSGSGQKGEVDVNCDGELERKLGNYCESVTQVNPPAKELGRVAGTERWLQWVSTAMGERREEGHRAAKGPQGQRRMLGTVIWNPRERLGSRVMSVDHESIQQADVPARI